MKLCENHDVSTAHVPLDCFRKRVVAEILGLCFCVRIRFAVPFVVMSTNSTTEKMPKRLLLPLISFCCALYGLHHFLNNVEENACDMTYMFEYPEYLVKLC